MRIIINNISPDIEKKWKNLLTGHPHNTIFQSPDMYSFYLKVQNFEPFLFYASDEDGNCMGILLAVIIKEGKGIKGYLSSRVVVYGGPVISEATENKNETLDLLLKALVNKLTKRSVFIQFRNFFEWSYSEKQIFLNNGFDYKERLNLLVNTSNKDLALSNISSSKRRQIRKALESGAKISQAQTEKEVREFYNLLFNLYKNKVKKPLPDWSFFKEFYNYSKENKLGIIRLIKFNDKIIGGILLPITPNKVIYEWYVVGLDKEYKKQYPSILATWFPIEYATNNQVHQFDFMGLGKPTDNYGVRDFKMKFGNNMVNYGRFGRRNKFLYGIVEFSYNLLRNMKRI